MKNRLDIQKSKKAGSACRLFFRLFFCGLGRPLHEQVVDGIDRPDFMRFRSVFQLNIANGLFADASCGHLTEDYRLLLVDMLGAALTPVDFCMHG